MLSIYLNHVYTTLDKSLYQAIISSTFLKDIFSGFREITVHSSHHQSWTGCYLYGKNTYIEFFSIDQLKNIQSLGLGHTAFAFSTDKISELKTLHEAYLDAFPQKTKLQSYPRLDEHNNSVPWFTKLEVLHQDPQSLKLSSWVMAYHPEYLQYRDHLSLSDNEGVTRELYNKVNYENKLLRDIKEIFIILDEKSTDQLLKEMNLFNFKITQSNNTYECITTDLIKIHIHVSNIEQPKLAKIIFSLNQSHHATREIIGSSILIIKENIAIWDLTNNTYLRK